VTGYVGAQRILLGSHHKRTRYTGCICDTEIPPRSHSPKLIARRTSTTPSSPKTMLHHTLPNGSPPISEEGSARVR
jgi:hypothetical protein